MRVILLEGRTIEVQFNHDHTSIHWILTDQWITYHFQPPLPLSWYGVK